MKIKDVYNDTIEVLDMNGGSQVFIEIVEGTTRTQVSLGSEAAEQLAYAIHNAVYHARENEK